MTAFRGSSSKSSSFVGSAPQVGKGHCGKTRAKSKSRADRRAPVSVSCLSLLEKSSRKTARGAISPDVQRSRRSRSPFQEPALAVVFQIRRAAHAPFGRSLFEPLSYATAAGKSFPLLPQRKTFRGVIPANSWNCRAGMRVIACRAAAVSTQSLPPCARAPHPRNRAGCAATL